MAKTDWNMTHMATDSELNDISNSIIRYYNNSDKRQRALLVRVLRTQLSIMRKK